MVSKKTLVKIKIKIFDMRTIYSKSLIDKDTEAYLWDSAIIVFDTCALLDFYYMTKENQEIIADILKTLSARI